MTDLNSKTIPRMPGRDLTIDRSVGDLWTEFAGITPSAHSFEDVCHPKYFGGHRTRHPNKPRAQDNGLRVGDIINLRARNNLWQARLIVRDVPLGSDEVLTDILELVEFRAEDIPDGYEILHGGDVKGWRIMMGDEQIEAGFATEEAAGNRLKYLMAEDEVRRKIREAPKKVLSTAKKKAPVKEAATAD
ncbi:MAG: hypothetical protein GOVbin52_45 [Prokaryotic dsDNA virus sp.]|nr:MAG: hypothetical protein GOVbin52_45 [Prokaryotic dsDNA virus sp.]